jgi:transcriptional regulator with XRE-family HTH domain
MDTGTKIKLYRVLNGMTQKELSEAVKTDPTYLVRYERGPIEPPTKIIFKLCEELGIEARWLIESDTAPYAFMLAEPIREGMNARQITGILNAFQELFPAFLEDSKVDAFCKIVLSDGAAYCFAFHVKARQGSLLHDGSVLIFILPEAYEKDMDRLLAAHSLVSEEPSRREVSLIKSILLKEGTDLSEGYKALQSILDRICNKGAEWINIEECIKAWRQRFQIQGKRYEWIIPVNVNISSKDRISREDALRLIEKMMNNAQKKLQGSLTIMTDYKKR